MAGTKPINPDHYRERSIEPIHVIDAWLQSEDFMLGSIVKYVARCKHSGSKQDDLLKAANYAYRAATGDWLPEEVLNNAKARGKRSGGDGAG